MQSAQERADRLSLFATYFDDPARINGEPDAIAPSRLMPLLSLHARDLQPTTAPHCSTSHGRLHDTPFPAQPIPGTPREYAFRKHHGTSSQRERAS